MVVTSDLFGVKKINKCQKEISSKMIFCQRHAM